MSSNGIVFVGPSPESIESFGLKHKARELAIKAGVPIVPGTDGLLVSEDDAVTAAKDLGLPVCKLSVKWKMLRDNQCTGHVESYRRWRRNGFDNLQNGGGSEGFVPNSPIEGSSII